MKEVKELTIIPYEQNDIDSASPLTTGKIIYNNYEIGTCQFNAGIPLPPMGIELGALYNTQYSYTLIFNNKECGLDQSLNVALNSIETNGFYQKNEGVFIPHSNLKIPCGLYKNIGTSPEGLRYNLELNTDQNKSIIILSRIC